MTRRTVIRILGVFSLGIAVSLAVHSRMYANRQDAAPPDTASATVSEAAGTAASGKGGPQSGDKTTFLVVNEGDAKNQPARSIQARPSQESYPVGTERIELVVTNHAQGDLQYTGWFDFRQVEGDTITQLTPREGEMENPEELSAVKLLKPGETVTIPVPINIFGQPLPAGTYRAAQLACFADAAGNALACTEITADFILK